MAGFWVGVQMSLGLLIPSSYKVLKQTSEATSPFVALFLRQIGLSENTSLSAIAVPIEVVLWRDTSKGTRTTCTDIQAGGRSASFSPPSLVPNYAY